MITSNHKTFQHSNPNFEPWSVSESGLERIDNLIRVGKNPDAHGLVITRKCHTMKL